MPLASDSEFSKFIVYSHMLRRLALQGIKDRTQQQWADICHAALNGEPAKTLRELVPIVARRSAGAFFTSSDLANRLLNEVQFPRSQPFIILDPTCGAGDLLLSAARRLPLGRNLLETISSWNDILYGRDLQPEFVSAAKARLLLLARQRHCAFAQTDIPWSKSFTNIRVGDALREELLYADSDFILLNPSFAPKSAPDDCSWAAGKVNSAALFLERVVAQACEGSRILAILPEVLRTGSRYNKWRQIISEHIEIKAVESAGRFDTSADVDVFLLSLVKRTKQRPTAPFAWLPQTILLRSKIEDHFTISVGPVVPYREPLTGPLRRYIHPRNVPPWQVVHHIAENRRFTGTVFHPPFVVIRRTSRPGDKFRAVGTLILGASPVAVENHLIVCTPKDGSIKTCSTLLRVLAHTQTTTFLNGCIRCRHLTVGSVKSLPWHTTD